MTGGIVRPCKTFCLAKDKFMKKKLIVMMMVLLSVMLIVSCDDSSNKIYKVTFDYEDGDDIEKEVKSGEKVTKPANDPIQDKLAFQYWSLDGTTPFDFNTAITKDITLKTVWDNPSKAGQTISLGTKDGAGIVWQVLDVDTNNKRALLISKEILEKRTFGAKSEGSSQNIYKGSAIQTYLNNTSNEGFIYTYGLSNVKILNVNVTDVIEKTTILNEKGDLVFLLSKAEYNTYKNTISTAGDTWWLRSPDGTVSVYVAEEKDVYTNSATVSTGYSYSFGVRPAFWYTWDKD